MLETRVSRPFFCQNGIFTREGLKTWTAQQVDTVPASLVILLGLVPGRGQAARTGFACPEKRGASRSAPLPSDSPLPTALGCLSGKLAKAEARPASEAPILRLAEKSNRSLCLCTQVCKGRACLQTAGSRLETPLSWAACQEGLRKLKPGLQAKRQSLG